MFNRRLNRNIKELDLQIGKLSKELDDMIKDSKYEITIDKLKTLTELRVKLAEKQGDELSEAVIEMDKQIEELTKKLAHLAADEEYSTKLNKLEELTKVRCQLAESKVKGSVKPIVISGGLSIITTLMVLKHEQTNVITSKAFGWLPGMFRGKQ